MMNGIVIRLAGVDQPTTRIFHQEVITIGTEADCDLTFDPGNLGLPPESVILTLRLREGVYRITTLDAMAGVTRDGEAVVVGDAIQDGDTFYFGATGIRLRFFSLSDSTEIGESLRLGSAVLAEAKASEAGVPRRRRSVPRTDVAIVFIKQLIRELVNEIPRRLLYTIAGVATFILLTIIYFNTLGFLEGRRNRKAIDDLKSTVGDTRHEIDKMRDELKQAREESAFVKSSIALPENVVNNYGRGVCLIYGVYSFVDPRVGKDLRLKEPSSAENPINPDGSLNLSVDGNGRAYEIEFTGTGFLVDKGFVLTNRHVVQAWEEDDVASLIKMRGFRPRLKELLAYFPQEKQPFTLRVLEMMQDQDVAICSFEQGKSDLAALPMDENGESIRKGQPVVLLGYPAGLEGLMARVDEGGRSGVRRFGNVSYRLQLNDLANNNKIRPQSTQGHISDVSPQLVYDARTDEGGSGGPVFGVNGKVIGINQAIFLNSQATTNFGVPIKFGIDLLKKHQQPVQTAKVN
ncbi:MAG: trypsin-like peptidase domain-containing protein [Acidobacteria bacterium]|nr:trypsin-like peptidase domain-containing protein [Acidobacteriota bacterium]